MNPRPRTEPTRLLTVATVADRCGVSLRSVRRWIADGRLPVHRLGRAIRIAERDLDRLLDAARG